MKKRGQGLSVSTIVIAAIALIVLVVLVAIFTGRLGIFGTELEGKSNVKCTELNTSYSKKLVADCPSGKQVLGATDVEPGQICCKP